MGSIDNDTTKSNSNTNDDPVMNEEPQALKSAYDSDDSNDEIGSTWLISHDFQGRNLPLTLNDFNNNRTEICKLMKKKRIKWVSISFLLILN
jgi:hypothetical protein